MKVPLSVIVLTHNEESNIEKCLKSVYEWAEEIFIVDSFSTDKTLDIARRYGSRVYQNPWLNYATQLNWALQNLPIKTEWIMRLDADERVLIELGDELTQVLPQLPSDITGAYVKRRVYFMDKWIKHGGYYPIWLLRVWRNGKGYCEKRWMDEHIKLIDGTARFLKNDIVDENQKNIHWWISKHNSYATREAIDVLNMKYHFLQYDEISASVTGTQDQRKRWLKNVYTRLPLFLRPLLYFLYRYVIKCGFLDGKEGLIWHFLQGFWYRFLVDAKIYEVEKKMAKGKSDIETVIETEYGIKLH